MLSHHGHAFLFRALCSLRMARRYALSPMTYSQLLLPSCSVCAVVFSIVFHLLLFGVLLNPVWVVQRAGIRELVFVGNDWSSYRLSVSCFVDVLAVEAYLGEWLEWVWRYPE